MIPGLGGFLRGEIDLHSFGHTDHVRMGFEFLRGTNFPTAAAAYSRSLKHTAACAGWPEAYHETITLGFLSLIGDRLAKSGEAGFDAFARANPDLLDKSVLYRWYAPERLHYALARQTFLLPDVAGE